MITLPIYYTQEFKTKPDKVWLVGMNAYRNWHYHIKNTIKQHYHTLVADQQSQLSPTDSTYTLDIKIYYKNTNCDGQNIANMMEKFTLDSLQELGIVQQDNVKFHMGTTWSIAGQSKLNPRAEITLLPAS